MSSSDIARNIAQFGSFRSRAATHAGTAGRNNEDAYLNRPDLGLWAVADGAGGHQSGEVASAEVVGLLQGIEPGLSAADMLQEVRARLETAHERLRAAASRRGAGVIMATTAVVVLARDDYFACLWVGDSPAYLLRGNTLTRITRDHSLVQDLVESGIITETEATSHPQANIITRAVGADTEALNLDKRTGRLVLGDRLLLCSDGVSKMLSDEQLAELLSVAGDTDAERLVMAALEAQAIDNVTAVIIDFDTGDSATTLEANRDSAPDLTSAGASAGSSADEHRGTAHDDGSAVGT
jgi:serine/threonine-protein phosphatase Stp1